jgi:hypothetical protein
MTVLQISGIRRESYQREAALVPPITSSFQPERVITQIKMTYLTHIPTFEMTTLFHAAAYWVQSTEYSLNGVSLQVSHHKLGKDGF